MDWSKEPELNPKSRTVKPLTLKSFTPKLYNPRPYNPKPRSSRILNPTLRRKDWIADRSAASSELSDTDAKALKVPQILGHYGLRIAFFCL